MKKAVNHKLGIFLKYSRQSKDLTLRAVEDATKISNAYVSQLESGMVAEPSPAILDKLAGCYDVSYTKLMQLAGYRIPKAGEG